MKAAKEIRQAVNRERSARGKRNGVVPYLLDHPIWERKIAKNKHIVRAFVAIALLLSSANAGAINRDDLIACMLGQAPEHSVCPDP